MWCEKEQKQSYKTGKKGTKPSFYTVDMNVYVANIKEKSPKLIIDYNKIAEYKITYKFNCFFVYQQRTDRFWK